jgi:hypothetical protein
MLPLHRRHRLSIASSLGSVELSADESPMTTPPPEEPKAPQSAAGVIHLPRSPLRGPSTAEAVSEGWETAPGVATDVRVEVRRISLHDSNGESRTDVYLEVRVISSSRSSKNCDGCEESVAIKKGEGTGTETEQ